MNKKIKREVQKEIQLLLSNSDKFNASVKKFQPKSEIINENSNDDPDPLSAMFIQNSTVKPDISVKKSKKRTASEDSDSSDSSSDEEDETSSDSDISESSYDYRARKKSKKSAKNKCNCAKNLKIMKKYFKKFDKSQKNIISEIKLLRDEINAKINVQNQDSTYEKLFEENGITKTENFEIIGLPCQTYDSFIEFEAECNRNPEAERGLIELFNKTRHTDAVKYVRLSMKKILTDAAAVKFTWFGFQHNIPVKGFLIIKLLKDACLDKFRNVSEDDVMNIIKRWFHHAKDRAKKAEKRHAIISNYSVQ